MLHAVHLLKNKDNCFVVFIFVNIFHSNIPIQFKYIQR